ncbi:MAG: 4-(cytidine 5'-diphospho)-2-C-methyl-D-erythritol kinase [Bacillota bacterium]
MRTGAQPSALEVRAHAKVNLALQVVGRRPDGYHEVRMVMTPLALHDRLRVAVTQGELTVAVSEPGIPAGPENLAYRAALALKEAAGCPLGAAIEIEKRIPAAAGLGGGSADAAAVLLALNRLWDLGWPLERLQRLAAPLGADIPFCLLGRTALAEGIGERLTPLPPAPPVPAVVATPEVRWPGPKTATVYRAWRPLPPAERAEPDRVLAALRRGDPAALAAGLANDLEPGATELQPVIGRLKAAMVAAGALGAVMAGAGPSVVALCPDAQVAAAVAAAARPLARWVVVTALAGEVDPFAPPAPSPGA